jgi:hypothetical protein
VRTAAMHPHTRGVAVRGGTVAELDWS